MQRPRRWNTTLMMLPVAAVLAAGAVACSNANGGGGSAQCEVGSWTSQSMVIPSQAGIGEVTQTGGGNGIAITLKADHSSLFDFGPMKPATATFVKAGQTGTLSVQLSGVASGKWAVGADGKVVITPTSFDTARGLATLTLGQTVPPIFDLTLKELNDSMMTGGRQVGVFTVDSCQNNHLSLVGPFPGGDIAIEAVRKT